MVNLSNLVINEQFINEVRVVILFSLLKKKIIILKDIL